MLQQTRDPTGISKGKSIEALPGKKGKVFGFAGCMALLLLPVCRDKSVFSLFTEIHGNSTAGAQQDYKPGVVLRHNR